MTIVNDLIETDLKTNVCEYKSKVRAVEHIFLIIQHFAKNQNYTRRPRANFKNENDHGT